MNKPAPASRAPRPNLRPTYLNIFCGTRTSQLASDCRTNVQSAYSSPSFSHGTQSSDSRLSAQTPPVTAPPSRATLSCTSATDDSLSLWDGRVAVCAVATGRAPPVWVTNLHTGTASATRELHHGHCAMQGLHADLEYQCRPMLSISPLAPRTRIARSRMNRARESHSVLRARLDGRTERTRLLLRPRFRKFLFLSPHPLAALLPVIAYVVNTVWTPFHDAILAIKYCAVSRAGKVEVGYIRARRSARLLSACLLASRW